MRSRIWICSLTAGALLAAGAVAPAYAAESTATDSGHSVTTRQAAGDGRDATVAEHVHMMADMADMAEMADMAAATNGMAKMHEAMMTHHHPVRPATPGLEHGMAEE